VSYKEWLESQFKLSYTVESDLVQMYYDGIECGGPVLHHAYNYEEVNLAFINVMDTILQDLMATASKEQ